jgi:hypothetical protein
MKQIFFTSQLINLLAWVSSLFSSAAGFIFSLNCFITTELKQLPIASASALAAAAKRFTLHLVLL